MSKRKRTTKGAAHHAAEVQAPPNHIKERSFNLVIRPEVHQKVMYWVDKCHLEVSGFGKVVYHQGTDTFEVIAAYLLDQEVGPVHTNIDAASLGKLMYQTHKEEGELKWWWHSHVNMSTFWSGTDKDTIKELGHQGWAVATVFNKKGEHRSALAYRTEHPTLGVQGHMVDELPLKVGYAVAAHEQEVWAEELSAKVREPEATQLAWPEYQGHKGWNDDRWAQQPGSHKSTYVPPTTQQTLLADPFQLTPKEREEVWKEGITGMGIASEAKHLGMTPTKWYNKFMEMGGSEYQEYEERLTKALYAGELT